MLHTTSDVLDMSGRAAIVTGAGTGIGRATPSVLGKRGATTVLVGPHEDSLQTVADDLVSAGGRATVVSADVTNPESCRAVVERTVKEFDRIDVLVNNAGGSRSRADHR